MLWPESDEERARNSLAQVVHALRREIGDTAVRTINGSIALDLARVTCDVVDFRAAIATGEHEHAVELYRGPFLEGTYLRDAPAFERWCDEQRIELTRMYVVSLQHLAEDAARRGDRSAAVQWWRRCANGDPLGGRIARRYIEALAADGKREEAIRHAEVYAGMVRAELGAEPDAGVVSLACELRNARDLVDARAVAGQPRDGVQPARLAPNESGPDPSAAVSAPDLAAVSASRSRSWPAPRRFLTGRSVRYAGIAAAIGVAVVAVRIVQAPPVDRRVVVAAFENRTGDPTLDQLGFMAADWIAQGLQRTHLTEVVDPGTATLASRNARSERLPLGDAREVAAMAAETRARLVVTGSYYRDGDSLAMVARVSDARDEKLLDALLPVRVAATAPTAAVEPLRERVLGALAMRLDPRLDPIVPPGSSPPPTYGAYLDFMQGLAAFQHGESRAAIDFFSRAAAADSTFALTLLWKVWVVGAASPSGDSILKRLSARREQLAPLDRAALEYDLATPDRDLRAKLAAAREAARLAPGSHWGHNVGMTLTNMGRFDEAVAAFEGVERQRGWTRDWPPFWDRFSVALHLAGNHTRELEIAREARRALPSAALPVYLEARALAAAGRVDELNGVIKDLEAYKEDADSLGKWLSLLARELETSGDTTAASRMHDRAVAWFATLPVDRRLLSAYRLQLGIALYRGGRYAEARPVFESLVSDSTRNRRDPNYDPHAYLGGIYAHLGERARADSVIRVLLSDSRPGSAAPALVWSARLAAAMGDKDRAMGYMRRQVALTGRGFAFHWDNRDLDGLLNYPPYRTLVEASDSAAPRTLTIRDHLPR